MSRFFSSSSDLVRYLCETLDQESPRAVAAAIPDGDWYGRRLSHVELDTISRQVWEAVTDGAEWPFGNTDFDALIADQQDGDA